jgi:polyisoprenoid-binding protein YceI
MKKVILSALTVGVAFSFVACSSQPSGEQAEVGDAQEVQKAGAGAATFVADKEQSKVEFVGSKPTGTHAGVFKLSEGTVSVENNTLIAGSFVIDINSLDITDEGIDADTEGKLRGHLLAPDFFTAEKFPTAKFELVKAEPYNASEDAPATVQGKPVDWKVEAPTHWITGNLTLKDSTKSVRFPAQVSISDTQVAAKAKFLIDRTLWGLFYGNDKSLGNRFIYPEVNIGFNFVAKKEAVQ